MHLYEKRPVFQWKGIVVTLVLFIVIAALFGTLMGRTGRAADREQAMLLRMAIRNAAVTHYAVEGRYPATLQEVVEMYGIIVDTDRFIVRYRIFGANVMPDISVVQKGENVQ